MMIGIDLEKFPEIANCTDFVECLGTEQACLAFPGTCFDYPGYFRFVLTIPEAQIVEACQRIQDFCYDHYKETDNSVVYQYNGDNVDSAGKTTRFMGNGVVVTVE